MAALSSVLASIRQHESGGRYNLTPQQNYDYPRSHASGAYQFQPGTWQSYTRQSGIGGQYSEAYQAPPNIQDAVAAYAATHGPGVNSTALWGGPQGGNYAPITSYDVTPLQLAGGQGNTGTPDAVVTTGPDGTPQTTVTGRPPANGGGGGGNTATTAGSSGGVAGLTAAAALPGYMPGIYGGPYAFGLTPGVAAALQGDVEATLQTAGSIASSTQSTARDIATGAETATGNAFRTAWAGALQSAENWVERWFIVIAAIAIIALALWRIMDPSGEKVAGFARSAAKAA